MRKGITNLVAVLLITIVAIALVGLVAGNFINIQETVGEGAEGELDRELEYSTERYAIERVSL